MDNHNAAEDGDGEDRDDGDEDDGGLDASGRKMGNLN